MKTCICGNEMKDGRSRRCRVCASKRIPVGVHPKEYDQRVISTLLESKSSPDAARKMGVSRTVTDRVIKEYNFDTQVFVKNLIEDTFVDRTGQRDYRDSNLRNIILKYNLIPYVCSVPECGQGPEYLDKPLTIDLEHKDGNPQNNRLDNLTFLCKYCHSQTDTYGNKRRGKVNHVTIRVDENGNNSTPNIV